MASSLMTSQDPPEHADRHEAHGAFDAIKHGSHEMKWILARAYRYASKDMPVLITGETGAGKELIAKAIHDASGRAGRQFVVDCAAIPASLLGDELFGHEKGAYTDANGKQPGLFAAAHWGSLFLYEIGELPLAAQSALLRVLSEKTRRSLGTGARSSTCRRSGRAWSISRRPSVTT